MIHFRDRSDLVLYAREHCGSRTCSNAIMDGKVVVLGGFSRIPPGTTPGWVLTVTSTRGKIWVLAVIPDQIRHCYRVYVLRKIPWRYWVGDQASHPIYISDVSALASQARMNAIAEDSEDG